MNDRLIYGNQQPVYRVPFLRRNLAARPSKKRQLRQILINIVGNAVKFTTEGSVQIRSEFKDGQLRCEIADTGIGVCADDREYIFDEFFQVDDAPSRSGGAGLGLALVRDLALLLDGEVAVSSDVGRGTSVSLQVPVSDSPNSQ